MRKKVKRNLLPKPVAQIDMAGLNILERTKHVNEIAKDVYNKICMETMTAQRERELVAQAEACMLACFSRLLLFKWNELRKRETRLNVMYTEVKHYQNTLETPSEEQPKAETEFCRQTGFKMTRSNNAEEVLARVDYNAIVDKERLDNFAVLAGENDALEVNSETLLCMINEILKGRKANKE